MWCCRKGFSQWLKLCFHWLKGLRQRQTVVVIPRVLCIWHSDYCWGYNYLYFPCQRTATHWKIWCTITPLLIWELRVSGTPSYGMWPCREIRHRKDMSAAQLIGLFYQHMLSTKHHFWGMHPDNKAHGAYMGPIWGRQDPEGPYVGHMNLAIRAYIITHQTFLWYVIGHLHHNFDGGLAKLGHGWVITSHSDIGM